MHGICEFPNDTALRTDCPLIHPTAASLAGHGISRMCARSGNIRSRRLACLGTKNQPRQQDNRPNCFWFPFMVRPPLMAFPAEATTELMANCEGSS